MKPVRVSRFAKKWSIATRENRRRGAAKLNRVQGVLDGLSERHVAADDRDALDANPGRAQRHDQRHGIVAGRVGVDQECAHSERLTILKDPSRETEALGAAVSGLIFG